MGAGHGGPFVHSVHCLLLHIFLQGDRRPKRRRKQLHDLSGVGSVGIVARGPLDEYRFNMFMRDLLAEKAKDIYRCKGVLAVHVSGAGWWTPACTGMECS